MGRLPSRRTVLLSALAAVAAAGTGVATDVLPGGPTLRRTLGLTGPDGSIPDAPPGPVEVDRVRSAARGRDVDLLITRPDGAPPTLPVCLALHGRGDGARSFEDLGVPQFLTAATRSGVPPFAVVAVDGGDNYYVARDPADDPQRMLVKELPSWLADRGLPPPTGLLGISMGAFGALRFARSRRDLHAVAVAAPALFQTWADAQDRDTFRDERHWAANEPLRHTADLAGVPLGVWCGTEDPFVDAARELIDRTRPESAEITAGAHENGYFLRVLPDMLRFVGTRLDSPEVGTPDTAGGRR
jgi:S-formylglutathione hydrolase FrmB